MPLLGKGMLVVFTEVKARDERDLNEWYNREHIDERINLPGFHRARRYVSVRASPKYLATYECDTVDDLATPGYLHLLANQTPWSQAVMDRFTHFHRMTLRTQVDLTHGIGGAAIIVDCMTDNRVRTVAEVRHAFSKYGGNLGTDGSVAFQFKHCGQIIFAPGTSEDKVMEVALEAGAEDVITDEEGAIEVLTAYTDFEAVKNALEAAGLKPEVAEVTMRAENSIPLTGEDAARMQKLLDILEDLDDVQEVFHNAEINE